MAPRSSSRSPFVVALVASVTLACDAARPVARTEATACTSCHGAPPAAPHPSRTDCGSCHDGYTATSANPALHLDGKVEIAGYACTGCHGDPSRAATAANPQLPAAPPVDTHQATATTAPGVGAHLAHLTDGAFRQALACSECHPVPSGVEHVDGVVALAFGPLANANGVVASWDAGTATCTTACHGAVAPGKPSLGGSVAAPVWTQVDGTQAACGACHALPPPAAQGHPAVSGGLGACATCHPATVKPDGTIDVASGAHINGAVDVQNAHPAGWSDPTAHGYAANTQGVGACQACHGTDFNGGSSGVSCNACHGGTAWQTTCTFCHGDTTRAATSLNPQLQAAPPVGTKGDQATSALAVGAHQQHLAAGPLAPAFACTECHAIPTGLAHVDGKAPAMAWGALATASGATPTWDRAATRTCTNYCHGKTLTGSGGTDTTPVWTQVDGTQAKCGTCHATTQLGTGEHQRHVARYSCGVCHGGYTATAANVSLHVNGKKDVGGSGTSVQSYSTSTKSCTPTCHGSETW